MVVFYLPRQVSIAQLSLCITIEKKSPWFSTLSMRFALNVSVKTNFLSFRAELFCVIALAVLDLNYRPG